MNRIDDYITVSTPQGEVKAKIIISYEERDDDEPAIEIRVCKTQIQWCFYFVYTCTFPFEISLFLDTIILKMYLVEYIVG